jgi:LPXTG-site transpeptidase (sortase) family protein
MAKSSKPNNDDKDGKQHNLKQRKQKVIKPIDKSLDADALLSDAPVVPGADKDLLEELRAKTAKLASKIGGDDPKNGKILKLDDKPIKKDAKQEKPKTTEDSHPIRDLMPDKTTPEENAAADLIRGKLQRIYENEPDAQIEAQEAKEAGRHRSKHQTFMYELTTSGKSLADIQTEWHSYYVNLPEDEKHEVWREFYANQEHTSRYASAQMKQKPKGKAKSNNTAKPKPENAKNSHQKHDIKEKDHPHKEPMMKKPRRSIFSRPDSVGEIKTKIHKKVSADGRLKPVHHFKSLLFGLGLAGVVGLIITFTFFNEVFIAPFISPSQSVSATPIIGNDTGDVGPDPKIIIPKINLEVPVVFGMDSIQEADIQNALEDGVVHYATSPNPGEIGNSVIVGHSSNNILNSGRYKFAFVLLKRLEVEDTFFVHKDGVRYTYKIYKKEIVDPDAVSVLGTQDRENTMTLITCDPPGTSLKRLIVVAEQISPDPAGNTASTAPEIEIDTTEPLPSAAPSLWSRLWPF